ncbi:vanadium-dependent haloperoxidase [Pontibacter sp. HSC-14F20]|uniref:vanadium-dependent haloperoxidase n=1 Tax=Pontibacter sp. HSC-14F20 TaxID=2864136 RepID=UPI001C7387CC|nr:vanadium-dependent haloperoxidase [Pontibacter sp. HSC-14F20]MBX0331860.1 vanadium-dependent haloperoxidase [Pontibacter sp. HSC-14F20]
MKTVYRIIGGLLIVVFLGACEKDEIGSLNPAATIASDAKGVDNFNNGMINSYSSNVVLQWNVLLGQNIDGLIPQPAEVKIYAMVTLAMHDALNNVLPKYETYALNNLNVDVSGISRKNIHAVADAAVSQAAHDMIVQLRSQATSDADALLGTILSDIDDETMRARGIDIGRRAAAAVLAKRAADFPLTFASSVLGTSPGEHKGNYEPWVMRFPMFQNPVYAPNLGRLTPFGIESGDQFRDEAPYPLNSAEYIADYNEVKALGCTECPLRTAEQTEIGAFWVENTSSSMNRLARVLIVQRKLDGWEAARLIALIEMSQIDAYIASFEGKYQFNFWRPITAVREGDQDGVDATTGDVDWTPTFDTPPTPDFPSTHAYNGAAASAVFKSFFHSDQINLNLISPYNVVGVERHYRSFSQIAYENAVSRIYIGYHFRYAVEVGLRQGTELGYYVYENNLRELKKVL